MNSHADAGPVTRVPVEHRLFGMDRRSFPIGVVVIAVFLVATVVIPRIDRAIAWDDPVRAGQRLSLTESLSFAPTAGWNVERGFRVGTSKAVLGHGPATVVSDGVTFDVFPDSFDGTPAELLRQIDRVTTATGNDPSFQVHDDPTTVQTSAGDTGVLQTYSTIRGDGIIAAFVIDGTGIRVTAFGPPEQLTAAADDIEAMIESIGPTGSDGGAS